MKVKIKKTGEIVEVSTARANYWIRTGFAVAVSDKQSTNETAQLKEEKEPESAYKVIKTEPAKKAVNKKKPTKKATK